MTVLKGLRDIGYARDASMYVPIIEGHLQSGNLQAAVRIYTALVLDWSMARAREIPMGAEREERMTSITRCKTMIAGRREVDGVKRDPRNRQIAPLPSVELLQPILKRINEHLADSPPVDGPHLIKIPAWVFGGQPQPLTTDRRPIGIVPKESPHLFWALESCRILSALLLHKLIPFHGYHELSPLLDTLRVVPEAPRYTVEVVLPPSQDYNPQTAPQWLQPRPKPYGWAQLTSVPHTFRPTLYLFIQTLLQVISGTSPEEVTPYAPLPIPERTLQTSNLLSINERYRAARAAMEQ